MNQTKMNTRHKTCLMILFIAITSGFAQCPTNKECHCELTNETFHQTANINCTLDNNSVFKLRISVNKVMTIDCMNSLELPDFNLHISFSEEQKDILFTDCNLVKNIKLIDIARMLGVTDIRSLMLRVYGNLNLSSTLEKHYLNGFENITSLLIINYNIFHVDKDLLAALKELRSFALIFTNLKYLPAEIFDYASKLNSLILPNNNLKQIEPSTFNKLKNLIDLNLRNNFLTELPSGIFDQLIALESLNVANNNLFSLPKDIFAKLENLEELYLTHNNFTYLPRDLLRNNAKLSRVDLSENKKNLTLSDGFFSNLTKLERLILNDNGLVRLSEDIFRRSYILNEIVLSNNYLQSLPPKIFQDLTNLEELYLNSNNLETLPHNIFRYTYRLKILDLSNNRISSFHKDVFNKLSISLEVLSMKQNLLKTISGFHEFRNLRKLNLSYNNISSIKIDLLLTRSSRAVFFPNVYDDIFDINLTHNKIQHISLHKNGTYIRNEITKTYRNIRLLVENNPFNCGCNIYDFLRYIEMHDVQNFIQIDVKNLTCHSPKELENVRVSDLISKQYSRNLTCWVKNTDSITVCPEMCDCFLKPYNKAFIFDCSYKNLINVPNIREPDILFIQNLSISVDTISQFYLNFSHNRLTQMPNLEKLKLRSVDKLFLSHNNISNISSNGLSRTTKDLQLHNNKLSRIHRDVLNYWKNSRNLTHLTLHENPWKCDCDTTDFYNFIISMQNNPEKPRIITSKITCHKKNTSISEMTLDDFCPMFDTTVIISINAAIALIGLIGIIFGLYYKYQEHIKIWLFAHHWCLWFVTEEELDKDKLFDAFVSFSHKDHDFIADELIPNLESGPTPFKLCVHYRNWLVGARIPTNIAISVEISKRTIIVLSPNFLESVWGRMEFRAAHRQALNEGRTRVILILYGDIGPIDDLDPELKAYISMNTYIQWGDPWFWDKLRYALPHQSRRLENSSARREVLENFKL